MGVWRGGQRERPAARGAPRRGLGRRDSGPGAPSAPSKARAAVPGARRAEAGRGAAERGPAGRGDARGARRACAAVGRVGVGAFSSGRRDAAFSSPRASRSPGRGRQGRR